MRVIVDVAGLQTDSRTRGIGRYTKNFLTSLFKTASEWEFLVIVNQDCGANIQLIKEDFQGVLPPESILSYRSMNGISYIDAETEIRRRISLISRDHFIRSLNPDIVLFSSLMEGFHEDFATGRSALLNGIPCVSIAYDLIPLFSPNEYLPDPNVKRWYLEKVRELAQSDLVLSISRSAAEEVRNALSLTPNQVVNISTAADDFIEIDVDPCVINELKNRHEIFADYFIYTASYEPRKNFDTLIEAFAQFASSQSRTFQLVLVTSNNEHTKFAISESLKSHGLSPESVCITGFVSDIELKCLYENSVAMVYPSFHEGFGLPVLEAMHSGTPVIGANSSSIKEIINYEPALFDPSSPEQISDLMTKLIADTDYRTDILENSLRQRALFSWTKSANEAVAALSNIRKFDPARRAEHTKATYDDLLAEVRKIPAFIDLKGSVELKAISAFLAANLDRADLASNRIVAGHVESAVANPASWRIEGPFDSTYSLALLNRETARAMREQGLEVHLHSTEGPGDYQPDETFLQKEHLDIYELWQNSAGEVGPNTIVSRNLYPPRVSGMKGSTRLMHHYAWEESRFPADWVRDFNQELDGLTCLSKHVQKVLEDSGVNVPMIVSGCGVDHWERISPDSNWQTPGKKFKFLHVSSCFPRKGADALLDAYCSEFSKNEDVTLIIKTFENPHNNIHAQIEALGDIHGELPDIHVITGDISNEALRALYEDCDILVAPSRAEGYGLPMAEAMLTGLPVITTNWSGQLDFCNENNSWLVDFTFTPADTHFQLAGSVWADPDVDHLASLMRKAFNSTSSVREEMASSGRELLLREHTWDKVVGRLANFAKQIDTYSEKPLKLGMITTWNCKCGIATYSEHLSNAMSDHPVIIAPKNDETLSDDKPFVFRTWEKDRPGASLRQTFKKIVELELNAIIIQFNYGLFDLFELNSFLQNLSENGVSAIIILHSTQDPEHDEAKRLSFLNEGFETCSKILVHNVTDMNRMKNAGHIHNLALFPHGLLTGHDTHFNSKSSEFTIGSFGFCLPHKGLMNLLLAFEQMQKHDDSLKLKLVNAEYPIDISRNLVISLREQAELLGIEKSVELMTDFFDDETALAHLRACDLIVFPYDQTGESASGAVRIGIASGRPVACSKSSIFSELSPITFEVDASGPDELSETLTQLVQKIRSNDRIVDEKATATKRWREDHDYNQLALRLENISKSSVNRISRIGE